MNEWMNEWMNKWMNEWMKEYTLNSDREEKAWQEKKNKR